MMNSMKKRLIAILAVTCCILLGGCGSDSKEQGMNIFYLNADKNTLLQEQYPNMTIEETLDKLGMHGVLNDTVEIEKFKLNNVTLNIFFTESYRKLSKSEEVLTRAAIVQTMTQIEQIDFVTFHVNGEPLKDKDGYEIGMMAAGDFVQSTSSSVDSYQLTDLTLYYADKDGMALQKKTINNVRYNANTSMERLIIEQLMKETKSEELQPTIPTSTALLGVSVKESVCYVNFDSKFVTESYDLNPEVAIYSVVNSLIANSSVTQVQILVDGESNELYKNTVDLSRPFLWNSTLIKGEVE